MVKLRPRCEAGDHNVCRMICMIIVMIMIIVFLVTGSKGSIINLEARSLKTWSSRSRHCVFVLMDNFTTEEYEKISAGSGALVLIVPPAPHTQEQQIVRFYI